MGCLKVLRDYIKRKGVFKTLYVDRAGIFGGPKRCNFSQAKRACEELGSEIIFANSAQGKGRNERSFDTIQDRLIPELRLMRIKRMESANRYLQETFISEYWEKQIQVNPQNGKSKFTPVPKGTDLDAIFVVKDYLKIRTDHTFSYGNRFYLNGNDYSFCRRNLLSAARYFNRCSRIGLVDSRWILPFASKSS